MLNIVIFGPPGCGKGTQSANLVKEFNLVHLSTGDIFRANINGNTELGQLAKSYMDKGNLVPDEVTIRMLETVVNQNPTASGFIFDGFPRNTAQAEALDKFLDSHGTSVTLMLALEVENEELKRRILERGKISGRADDQDPVIVENRIKVYNEQTAPLIGYYASQSKSYAVDGQVSVTEVFDSLCFAIRRATQKSAENTAKKVAKPVVKKAVKKTAPKKVAKPVAKKAVKKAAPKKAAKPVAKKAVKKAAPKKAAKPVAKKAVKKAAPKKAAKPVAKKAVKKAAPKKAAKPVAKKAVKKAAPKKTAKPVSKKAVKKTAPKKAAKPVAKKAVKKAAPKKAAKPVAKKAVKKAAPKKAAKPVAKKAVKKAAKKGRK